MRKLKTYELFMLNEMYLIFEEDFFDTLQIISKKHNDKVAAALIKLGGGDFEKLRQTYIGLSREVGKASFTNHPESDKKQLANIGKVVNSIINAVRQWVKEYNLDDPFIEVNEEDVYKFVTRYKGEQQLVNDMEKYLEVVDGEDIRKFYNLNNYYNQESDLGKSCMRHAHKSGFLDIYANNTDVCKMLILKSPEDTNLIVGRAILWTDVAIYSNKGYQMKFEKQGKLMDRIYTNEESLVNVFKNWANDNGYHYKESQNNDEHFTAIYKGSEDESAKYFTVEVGSDHYSQWPYMDTLKYFFKDNMIISNNDGYFGTKYDMGLEEMDGSCDCVHCDGGHNLCPDCNKGIQECGDCEGRGNWACGTCDGDGSIEIEDSEGDTEQVDCEECAGRGNLDCEYCNGDGQVECSTCQTNYDSESCEYCEGTGK